MYVDLKTEKDNKSNYRVSIYREGKVERVASSNMNRIAEYIQMIAKDNETVYVDNRGFGLYLIDCLRRVDVPYSVLYYSSLNLDKLVGE